MAEEGDTTEEVDTNGKDPSRPCEININMVLVLPSKFLAPQGLSGNLDGYFLEERPDIRPRSKEEFLAIAFNKVIHRDEPNKYRPLKPLYSSAHVEGVPISRILIECGATVMLEICL